MRRSVVFRVSAVLACFVYTGWLASQVVEAKSWGFTNSDFSGSYASQWTGTVNFPGPPLSAFNGPYAMLGRLVVDGQGGMRAKWVECYNGAIIRAEGEGSYSVRPDGTVTAVASYELAGLGRITFEFTGVLFDDGKQVRLMASRIIEPAVPQGFTGIVATATLVRQGKTWGWGDSDMNGSYVTRMNATFALPAGHPLAVLNGPAAAVGRVAFDGQGNFALSSLTSLNGMMVPLAGAGTYRVNLDGTYKATATLDLGPLGKVTMVFDGVITDGGNQMFLLLTEVPGGLLPSGSVGATFTEIHARQ